MTVPLNPDYQCRGKSTYRTKADAKRAARRTQTAAGRAALGPYPLVAYRCPWGDHFHFGHMTPSLRAKLAVLRDDDEDDGQT